MKKVFLEDLPRKNGNRVIDWNLTKGYKVKFIYEDIKGKVEIINYEKNYLYLKYEERDIFKIKTNNFQRCKIAKMLGKITNEFKIEIGAQFQDDKRDIIIIDREYRDRVDNKGNNKYYKYKCNKCGYDQGWMVEGSLLGQSCGCSVCKGLTVVEGINDIYSQEYWMVKYFQNPDDAKKYTKNSNKEIFPICPDCGKIKDKKMAICTIFSLKSIGCTCGDGFSYPEKFMFNMLEQLNINFETQYSPEWIGLKRYDFYIPSKNLIIETDGGLGHGKKMHGKSNKTLEESIADDKYKDKQARLHNIEVIRINCDESSLEYMINNILNSKVATIFNLSCIDWTKCEEFALSNRVKEVCKLKRDNPNMTTKEIAKTMNMNYNTIGKYLRQGSKIGWCGYDAKELNFRGSNKPGKMNGKPVEMFDKEGNSLGIFESCAELSRQSEKLFGIKLNQSSISEVAINKRKQYKGFTFKYI